MSKSPWGHHIRYHLDKAKEHLSRAQEHIPARNMMNPESDPDDYSKDVALGMTQNLKDQIQTFLSNFEKPEPTSSTEKEQDQQPEENLNA